MLDQAYGQNPKKATLEEVEQLTLKSIKKARQGKCQKTKKYLKLLN